MYDLDLLVLAFHMHHMEFATLDSKTAEGIGKTILAEFKRIVKVLKQKITPTGSKNRTGEAQLHRHLIKETTEWYEEEEEFARHKAYTLHMELFNIKNTPEMSTIRPTSEVLSLR